MAEQDLPTTVIIGAGPAGLSAAYLLAKEGAPVSVFEADDIVGGISRTVERDGWRFDIGGHRFFTKVGRVEALWREILPEEDFLRRPRMSRIYYRGKLFDYPLRAANALRKLGPIEALRCVGSYAWARVRPPKDQSHMEGWVSARFGKRLYSIFFKTYTEKVWGMPATEVQADWAAQRIKNLSLSKAIINALTPRRNQTKITSLIEEFDYPKYGPGMMWEVCATKVEKLGGTVALSTPVVGIERGEDGTLAVTVSDGAEQLDGGAEQPDGGSEQPDGGAGQPGGSSGRTGSDGGTERTVPADHVISSMPLSQLVRILKPAAPPEVLAAANQLRYRDFLTVALVVPEQYSFPDNWIYIHQPEVQVGRIQNFGSWSPYLVKDGRTCLGLEYFVHEGDELWDSSDADLIAMGTRELEKLDLVKPGVVEVGYVVRMPKAYPVYDEDYQTNVEVIRRWLDHAAPNIHPVGRNGMHRYNNQDHSMMTAMLSVENILGGAGHDIWAVNVEEEYHEEKASPGHHGTGRAAPILPRQ